MQILPHQLPEALDAVPASILSLDCFDTLLWRTTHTPRDVFAALPGITPDQRRWAESHARSHALLARRSSEARIEEIYAQLMPRASERAREAAVAAELDAEARHCFGFAPTVALMRQAKRRGMPIAIVSDTYLSEAELRVLIGRAAGADVAALIDHVFCSSDYGVAKTEGLFTHMLKALKVRPEAILHIGDNRAADLDAPQALGIQALHLRQFADATEQRLRMEAAVAAMLAGSAGTRPVHQPHRARLAIAEPQIASAAAAAGYAVLGPVLATFVEWLRDEVATLQARTPGAVKLLFLMRDGYLPHLMWNAMGGMAGISAETAEISRFTATAASFRSRGDVERYLEREAGTKEFDRIARQLLLRKREAAPRSGARDGLAFVDTLRKSANVDQIVRRSRAFAARLCAHVRQAIDPKAGDTIMLVDLGYNGTVQNGVDDLLTKSFNVHVAGRYLLLREQELSGLDKAGLFSPDHHDQGALDALCGSIAALEQLVTAPQGSVVDYDEDGAPIRTTSGVKSRQSETRDLVQAGCLEYGQSGFSAAVQTAACDTLDTRRDHAAAVLGRFLFFPSDVELSMLQAFEHDVNQGAEEMVPLFDAVTATAELRRHGMFYMKDADRMFLPAELQPHGLPLSLALFVQRRLGLDLRRVDFNGAALPVPIIVADGRDVSNHLVEAHATHDGFYALHVPVGRWRYAVGVQFGRLSEWVELASVEFVPAWALGAGAAAMSKHQVTAKPTFEGLDEVSPGLLRRTEGHGFLMVPPAGGDARHDMVLSLVFRPIGTSTTRALSGGTTPAAVLNAA